MYTFIAITTVLLLFVNDQSIFVSAQTRSTTIKQCGADQHCVDVSNCQEFDTESDSSESFLSRYEEEMAKLDEIFCGNDPKTGYRKFCCNIPPENKINTPGCGLPIENRILIPTYDLFENPWMALIRDRKHHIYCAGTVIAGSFVLTAASCSHASNGGSTVRVGEFDISSPVDCSTDENKCAEAPIDVSILTIIVNPLYDRITGKNNIALLKTTTVQFSDTVRPICLSSDAQSSRGGIVGWSSHEKPRKTLVSVVEADKCQQTIEGYSNGTMSMENKLCVRMEVFGDCQDSRQNILPGSPFQAGIGHGGSLVQQGILVATSDCNRTDGVTYAVLTNVTSYMDWIKDNIPYIYPRMRF